MLLSGGAALTRPTIVPFSLSLWERVGVRASDRTSPPKFDPLILFSQKRLPSICTLLIMIIIVTLIAIYKHYVTYG